VNQEYSVEKDVMLWSDAPDFYLKLAPGSFLILYPQDAHAPLSGAGEIKKAVFKIRVNAHAASKSNT
jgi:YhcH/YjgK/YiaL family protein